MILARLCRRLPAPLRARLSTWNERFNARTVRERVLIALAAVAVFALMGDALLLSPQRQRAATLNTRLADLGSAVSRLQSQIVGLQGALDPDAANRNALAAHQEELADLQGRLRAYDRSLVPPEQAAALLESLVKSQPGVTLLSLKTLAPLPLIEHAVGKGGEEAAQAAPREGVPSVFRHGVEIKVAGTYADLQRYLSHLEAAPQKLLWGKLDLTVERYPRSVMTLTVYSLSLDPAWLAL